MTRKRRSFTPEFKREAASLALHQWGWTVAMNSMSRYEAVSRAPAGGAMCFQGGCVAFSDSERDALLSVKGVGPTVVKRFEEIGIDTLSDLAACQADDIAEMVASMLKTTCWKNSPQARAAIEAAISRAKSGE